MQTTTRQKFLLASLSSLMLSAAQAAVTYTQAFDSGTDTWISRGSTDQNGFSTFANAANGQSGNCLQVTDGGFGWGAAKSVTGVVAGESYTLTMWIKMPATFVYNTSDPKIFVRQMDAGGALIGSVQRSVQITTTDAWVQLTLNGTIQSGATQVRIGIGDTRGSGSATCFIDTVSFTSSAAILPPGNFVSTTAGQGSFVGSVNSTYNVEYTDSLNPFNWQPLTSVLTDGVTGVGTFSDPTNPATLSHRYYRIAVP